MEAANAAESTSASQAEKQEDESEISDPLKACANYFYSTRIGDKMCCDKSLAAQQLALVLKHRGSARESTSRSPSWFVHIGFFSDNKIITSNMADAEKLIEEGGDWDWRNRLKVYQGLHPISPRQFRRGVHSVGADVV
ncbi:hypothetical protein CVT25_013013 [Psilocybe cyanescens]|uniref:26S proteasome regulatory subunit Rpn7 N-terminal domain-containing protein n=1 Tax=Psilocybe cyanescens TaxID=93625 RepID=A0A409XLW0_PSICY|nr:hypothetical protein CVT25_013013 [Psilocybe cyanescens]